MTLQQKVAEEPKSFQNNLGKQIAEQNQHRHCTPIFKADCMSLLSLSHKSLEISAPSGTADMS